MDEPDILKQLRAAGRRLLKAKPAKPRGRGPAGPQANGAAAAKTAKAVVEAQKDATLADYLVAALLDKGLCGDVPAAKQLMALAEPPQPARDEGLIGAWQRQQAAAPEGDDG